MATNVAAKAVAEAVGHMLETAANVSHLHGKTVCVTGAGGFLAGHLTKQLLIDGCKVHGTVRDPESSSISYLKSLPGATGQLQLFKADLLKPNSFDEAISGCDIVFHTASPVVILNAGNPDDVTKPAIEGTKNVYESCKKAGVKKIVTTSSFATIIFGHDHTVDETPYTDKEWNTVSKPSIDDAGHTYRFAKVEAEKYGWEFAKENPDISLITINPPMIIGPWLEGYSRPNDSSIVIANILNGKTEPAKSGGIGWVDVRDVVAAHIAASTEGGAHGRYLINTESLLHHEVHKILAELFPESKVCLTAPTESLKKPLFDITRTTKELQWHPQHSIHDALREQGQSLKRCGLLS
eukprot:m.337071 g.337071  ORF g.337071 m.337071 type:complete len:352 (+) comp18039_c0_seq1:245-1300(+)